MIKVEIGNDEITQALNKLSDQPRIVHSILDQIGEYLIDSTKQRFRASTGPDGKRWAPNTEVTIMEYMGKFSGSYTKKGKISKRGAERARDKRPLFGETTVLNLTIGKRIVGNDTLLVGSPMGYAAAQQFGMKKGYAGRNSKGRPIPWGDIPARPFLGISGDDRDTILDIISMSLTEYLKP